MSKLRVGILGCGGFANRHAQNIVALPDELELVAFSDRHPERAGGYCAQYTAGKAAVYTDHHELIEKAHLDLLVISLPPYGHSDEVELAARAGIHLLMEKPIALSSEHAWQMVRAVESAGVKTQVGFMFRFGEAIEALKGMIARGETGPAGLMSARYFCNALHAHWWRNREKSGGQLVEQVIHMVDLMRYLMGEAETVYSRQENVFHREMPDYTVEDVSATVFGFSGGALGVIYATNGAIPGRWINDYRFVAQKLTAEFSNANQAVFHHTGGAEVTTSSVAGERNVHLAELRDLLRAIRAGGETRTPMREGARSLDLALAARESAERGEVVKISG